MAPGAEPGMSTVAEPVRSDGSVTVGFVGLGQMGEPIVERLLGRNYRVLAFDTNSEALDRCAGRGATAATCPEEIADEAELVMACLPHMEASIDVATSVAGGKRVAVYSELSTIGPQAIEDIGAIVGPRAIDLVDAPVSGGRRAAQTGALSMMASGPGGAVSQLESVAGAFVGEFLRIGERAGQSQLCKLVNNALNFTALAVSCEAIAVGVKAGIGARNLVDVINAGTGRNSATVDKIPRAILPRTFDLGGGLGAALKDIDLYLDEATKAGLPAGVIQETGNLWRKALDELAPGGDASHIARFFEALLNVEMRA